ncbi:MAG: small basic family protein [Clostridiales bacterium]|nr:small basic family protein [Clostridiales bacterium]MCF8021354.1 small basic family protein [Clostridiales bacterium]
MWAGIVLVILGTLVGIFLGLNIPVSLPEYYAVYTSVAALAAVDSVLGGIRAAVDDSFDHVIFISGFFTNAMLAAGLVFIGDRLGIDLYLAAVVAFGVRIFQNVSLIRRHLLNRK